MKAILFFLIVFFSAASASAQDVLVEEKESNWLEVPVTATSSAAGTAANPVRTRRAVTPAAPSATNTRPAAVRRQPAPATTTPSATTPSAKAPAQPAVNAPAKASETFNRTNSKVGRFKKAKG